ncbi:hypothetical protein [Flavisolibacter tropicus]|uniref:Uncharacterized protein n=1 Tax=Flavisolibacter tropicus TaxID=1492898 RepID=A0A172TS96_9BACT|nr:hypothetical protein [Flavisolibacter tropicus]ANE49959.1 hypothetical protein SY85_05050 [Flavisolibacter tropicus]
MIFDDFSFHDAIVLEVREDTASQTLDFLLHFPVDWENNVFENKVLRFKDAIVYIKKEIPFLGRPTIMEIKQLHSQKHTYMNAYGTVQSSKLKVEIMTNAGSRFVEFNEAELLDA